MKVVINTLELILVTGLAAPSPWNRISQPTTPGKESPYPMSGEYRHLRNIGLSAWLCRDGIERLIRSIVAPWLTLTQDTPGLSRLPFQASFASRLADGRIFSLNLQPLRVIHIHNVNSYDLIVFLPVGFRV